MDFLNRRKRSAAGALFWLLDGMSYADTLGAWRFQGVNTEADAKADLTGHGNTLTNSGCSWSAASGFYVNNSNYLDQSSLRGSGQMKSIVMKIANDWNGNYHCLTGNWGGISVWLKTPFETASFYFHYQDGGVAHGAGISVDATTGSNKIARENLRLTTGELTAGVIGFSNSGWGLLYKDGTALSLRNGTATSGSYQGPWTRWQSAQVGIPRLVGGTGSVNSVTMNGYFYIQYLAVYSRVLTQAEHAAIAAKMV